MAVDWETGVPPDGFWAFNRWGIYSDMWQVLPAIVSSASYITGIGLTWKNAPIDVTKNYSLKLKIEDSGASRVFNLDLGYLEDSTDFSVLNPNGFNDDYMACYQDTNPAYHTLTHFTRVAVNDDFGESEDIYASLRDNLMESPFPLGGDFSIYFRSSPFSSSSTTSNVEMQLIEVPWPPPGPSIFVKQFGQLKPAKAFTKRSGILLPADNIIYKGP